MVIHSNSDSYINKKVGAFNNSMVVYIVQEGDTITSIANKFNMSVTRLIEENMISHPDTLVEGDTFVITFPKQTHIVEEGDSLLNIAKQYHVPLMQLYRNNPYLWNKEYLTVGEELVISYDQKVETRTNAYAFPFIGKDVLNKTLPYLTYLSIMNYRMLRKGEIESSYDDSEIIAIAKDFGVQPILFIGSTDLRGERHPEIAYEILISPEAQDYQAQNMIKILKEKGYYGINISFTLINETNQKLYVDYLKRIASHLAKEKIPIFITIDTYNMEEENGIGDFSEVDYSYFNNIIEGAYLMRFYWGFLYGPPQPITSIQNTTLLVEDLIEMIDSNKLNIGVPLLAYFWFLPYITGYSYANAVAVNSAINLATVRETPILFDEQSKTPYYYDEFETRSEKVRNEVRFVDARTINELVKLVIKYELQGTGLWNIMSFYPQLWLVINSTFHIIKLLPEK